MAVVPVGEGIANKEVLVVEETTALQDAAEPQSNPAQQPSWWEKLVSALLTPSTLKEWAIFVAVWGSIVGLAVWFVVWAFPRIVDSAFDPAVAAIDKKLTRVEIGVVVASAVMLLPITLILTKEPFVWLAAALFSFQEAFGMVYAGLIPGMAIPFVMARLWFRKPLLRFLSRYRYTKAVLLGVRKAGPFMTTIILRLGPVPQPLVNYLMGVPPADHSDYFFLKYMAARAIGSVPGTLVAVIFGRNIKGLSAMIQGEKLPASQIAVNLVSLAAAVILVAGGWIYAKRSLSQLELEAAAEEAGPRNVMQPAETLTTDATFIVVQAVPQDGPSPTGSDMGMAAGLLHKPVEGAPYQQVLLEENTVEGPDGSGSMPCQAQGYSHGTGHVVSLAPEAADLDAPLGTKQFNRATRPAYCDSQPFLVAQEPSIVGLSAQTGRLAHMQAPAGASPQQVSADTEPLVLHGEPLLLPGRNMSATASPQETFAAAPAPVTPPTG